MHKLPKNYVQKQYKYSDIPESHRFIISEQDYNDLTGYLDSLNVSYGVEYLKSNLIFITVIDNIADKEMHIQMSNPAELYLFISEFVGEECYLIQKTNYDGGIEEIKEFLK